MAPQDSFIDEEDDTCPLCIEEFDLSDRNFRPCPCGYQVCQFCYNNLKNNLNGLCPACRRPYDEKDIQWKVVTNEEEAEFRANIQKNQKKRASEQRQKEVQKREAEKESRKNLQGVRVVQKNLVYVTGLTPGVREDELLKTLRKHEFFGQYGNIQKISISNRKSSDGQQQSLGIYVTFERQEDAARCIAAVDGAENGDRCLKAQLGTTKYCSAWLRHEQCGNRQCMFLHELGDEEDSYTRQDLSSLNSVSTQRPLSSATSSSRPIPRAQAPKVPPPAASQPMARSLSKEGSEGGDGPALPATANWARTNQQRSRRGSHATSGATSSPAISTSLPATNETVQEPVDSGPPFSRKAEKQLADTPAKTETVSTQAPSISKRHSNGIETSIKVLMSIPPDAWDYPWVDDDMNYPPMFNLDRATRRRALLDAESRLADHDDHLDNLAHSDGEPESGSLALGGEPEEHSRNGLDYIPGRNPPIQRGANDLFGPSLAAFGQNSASVGSMGSRTMTPQQQLFMRPQGSFTDQMPPGISQQQPSLFQGQGQGQGHSRQQSRFSFANENSASSVNVKSSADPRYMAQQNSMMPSSYRSGANQLYQTTVSGPPPGLKSTGTPPVSGNMFGQGHGFGGSNFGAVKNETQNDLLQSLIRRGVAGGQGHEQGKREYQIPQFPTFHNQYPSSTSSTPAPAQAPGLLASLYVSQPGAFPDYGPKQKKKGKKHRHANTSSSGGSGLVDSVDPSILQIHHQQQGNNVRAGQGLFGGQSQDDDDLDMDEATLAVDALVSDPSEFEDLMRRTDGRSTPSLPPGLSMSHGHPAVLSGEGVQSPVLPDRSLSRNSTARSISHTAPRPATPLATTPLVKSALLRGKDESPVAKSDAKKSIKELASTSGLAQDIAAQASKAAKSSLLQEEDFPALDSVKQESVIKTPATATSKLAQVSKTPSGKKSTAEGLSKTSTETRPKKTDKRPVPGILDIAAATSSASQQQITEAKTGDLDKILTQTSAKAPPSSALATPTPTTASISSPLAKAMPKTLRLVQTPKSESPLAAAVASIRSGAAASSSHRPMTPASEIVSDTASVISTSISVSRTSSPPPSSRIGSLPVRPATKSQQRKQRKDASKEAAAQIADTPVFEPEVGIAPIIGRKKKQKKEKKSPTAASRASSRPETPTAAEHVEEKPATDKTSGKQSVELGSKFKRETKQPVAEPAEAKAEKAKDVSPPPQSPVPVDTSIKLNESTKTTVLTPDYVTHTPEVRNEQPVEQDIGEIPQLRDVFRKLLEEEALSELDRMSFFKAAAGYRSDTTANNPPTALPPTLKTIVAKEDEEKLNAFQPVRKTVNDQYVLLTPNGDCLLNLTPAEADLFLDLQERLRSDSVRPTTYSAPRYSPASGFSLVKNRAVPNGAPSFFPLGPDNYPSDPVGKMHREEAISCINQHVLPSLNLGSYKTMGPNSNFTKNVNLQQLAPWIYPPTDGTDDRKMFTGRSTDDYNSGRNSAVDSAYGSYDHPEQYPPSPAIGSTPLMSVEDAETVWVQVKKQHEALDKKFRQLQQKNRRLVDLH
ncbi:hypothetical protein F5Y18DRAFT_51433 [Xylariaceae sp. FL1019]|nr:hypothetical protein F5Y18DRAFT_51433 [Xylariaceae sp. FL1019]